MNAKVSVICALALAACAEGAVSFTETWKLALNRDPAAAIDAAPLNPKYRYLRVTYDEGAALLVLNFLDKHPNGPVEVWYGGAGEVFRFQNGRWGGHAGVEPEWRLVALPPFPAWADLADRSEPLRWERYRDVMPGYRFGIRDRLMLRPIPAPDKSSLVGVDARSLRWFEERTEADSAEQLPAARYAVRGETVVYAEQCVSPRRCFKWQRWPAGS